MNQDTQAKLNYHLKQLLAKLNATTNAGFIKWVEKTPEKQLVNMMKDMDYLKSNPTTFGVSESGIKMLENRIAIIKNHTGVDVSGNGSGNKRDENSDSGSGDGFVDTLKKDSSKVVQKAEEVGSNTGYAFLVGMIGGFVLAHFTGKSKVLYTIAGGVGFAGLSFMYYKSKKSSTSSDEDKNSGKKSEDKTNETKVTKL